MAKDRLGELKKAIKAEDKNLISGHAVELEPLTGSDVRSILNRAEVVRQWIERVEDNLETVLTYVKQLNDVNVNQKELNEKVESVFTNNTVIFHKIHSKLKEFEEDVKMTAAGNGGGAEMRIKTMQLNTLKTRYQKTVACHSKELETFRNLKKCQLKAQLTAKGVNVTDHELDDLLANGDDIHIFTENILAETAETKRILQDLEDRHRQLLKIETMLTDVRDLFLQMSILINDQQDVIDIIEYQASVAVESVKQGRGELRESETMKKRFLKKKVIFLIIAVIIVVILLAVLLK